MIGWANLALKNGDLTSDLGYVSGKPPRDRRFKQELEAELERMRHFLGPERTEPSPRQRAAATTTARK